MPWIRFLTLTTFRRLNPDWQMKLWTPVDPVRAKHLINLDETPNFMDRILELGIEIHPIDVEELAGVSLAVDVPSIHVREQVKGDYLRAWLLAQYGGLSCDMDILFYKSMDALPVNRAHLTAPMSVVTLHRDVYYWGFMLGTTDSPHFGQMWEAAKRVDTTEFRGGHNFYRVAGHLAKELWPELPPGMWNLPFHTIYANTDRFDLEWEFPESPHRIGIHWHGSSTYGTFITLTPENWHTLPPMLMRKCLERVWSG